MDPAVASKLLEVSGGVPLALLCIILLVRTGVFVLDRLVAWRAVQSAAREGHSVEFQATLGHVSFKITPSEHEENRFEDRRLTPLSEGREPA
jgi:hypothetical protein